MERQSPNLFRNFIVIADAIVQRQIRTNLPGVLSEKCYRLVADTADGISESLNEVRWEAETVLLDWREVRRTRKRGIERRRRQASKVEQAGKVQFKDRFWNPNEGDVAAKLEVVISGNQVDVIGELITRFASALLARTTRVQ